MHVYCSLRMDHSVSPACPYRHSHNIHLCHRMDCRLHTIDGNDIPRRCLSKSKRSSERQFKSGSVSACCWGYKLCHANGERRRYWLGIHDMRGRPSNCASRDNAAMDSYENITHWEL